MRLFAGSGQGAQVAVPYACYVWEAEADLKLFLQAANTNIPRCCLDSRWHLPRMPRSGAVRVSE